MKGTRRICGVIVITLGIALLPTGILGLGEDGSSASERSLLQKPEATLLDVDGNTYRTVTIGTQVWMAENLRVTHYRDRTPIPPVPDAERWGSAGIGAYCFPEKDSRAPNDAYGLLYNFHAVEDGRGLCPPGWHVPAAAEWRTLIERLGGVEAAGGKMKDVASGLWRVPVPGTTNESGFSALPAGGRGRLGSAGEAGRYATWWSSTPDDSTYAWHWGLYPDKNGIRANPGHKASGFSVRCVKD